MSSTPTIIGIETEYAIAPRHLLAPAPDARSGEGVPAGAEQCGGAPSLRDRHHGRIAMVINRIVAGRATLPGARSGFFFGNGARIYDDRGHIEYCTPEAAEPADAVVHLLAGHLMISRAMAERHARSRLDEYGLFTIGLDYAEGGCSSWGCHENYASGSNEVVGAAIAPHLCSRMILCGAGGLDPSQPLAFTLSPRAAHMSRAWTNADIGALFHSRQNFSDQEGVDRLQVVSGESLRSHLGNFLKVGTTALLAWLAEHGHVIGQEFRPTMPHCALRTFARDVRAQLRVPCGKNNHCSALDIQTGLLDMCEKAGEKCGLPHWSPLVIELWRQSLQQFKQGGRRGLERSVDWAIKWAMFDAHCRAAGLSFERAQSWNLTMRRIGKFIPHFWLMLDRVQQAIGLLKNRPMQWRGALAKTSAAGGSSLDLDELAAVMELRLQLRELDWRFSQIGDGVFDQLDRQGVLRHQVPGINDEAIEAAMTAPPPHTRAQTRGQIIQQWHTAGASPRGRCDWDEVIDDETNQVMRLDDLTDGEARWEKIEPDQPQATSHSFADLWFDRAIELYRTSHFAMSASMLSQRRRRIPWALVDARRPTTIPYRVLRYSAWVEARLGNAGAFQHLSDVHGDEIDAEDFLKVSDYLYCHRFYGLVPHRGIEPWLVPARQLMDAEAPLSEPLHASVREHVGAYLLYRGDLDEAEAAIGNAGQEMCKWRRIRIHCILAEIERQRGRPGKAQHLLDGVHSDTGLWRDALTAEQIIPGMAKLLPEAATRQHCLTAAANVLRRHGHVMALVRVLLLRVRGYSDPPVVREIQQEVSALVNATDALRQCPLAQRIMQQWTRWTQDLGPDESGDLFWGL